MSDPNPRIMDGTQLTSEITLRDLFAAAALVGLLSDQNRAGGFDEYALDAFDCADAMLRERAK